MKRLEGNLWGLRDGEEGNCWSGFKWNCCGNVFRNRKIRDKSARSTPVVSVMVLPVDSDM